ncbi:MAG: hypothetical protein ACYTEV_05275 [Planctomycetota bacterium]|jgi:hypothetical protein
MMNASESRVAEPSAISASSARPVRDPASIIAGAGAAAWGVTLVTGGAMHGDAPWAVAAFSAGLVCVGGSLLAWLARRPAAAIAVAVAATGGGAVAAGWLAADPETTRLGVGGLMLLGMLGWLGLVLRPAGAVAGVSSRSAATTAGDGLVRLAPEFEQILRRIDEHAMLSDNARRVLFRERELALLEQAIEEDIRDGRFDVAATLADEFGEVFGERERAEAFRQRILQDRRQRHEAVRHTMLLELDGLLGHRQWRAAREVADRLRRAQPDAELEADIERRFLAARARHKADLEASFLEGVDRGDTEGAMRLLRELDHYLTGEEAERYRELAGGVIKQHRENLGVQFKLAVNDHRWAEAVRIGETIVSEFPNTKMAVEVRSMIDLLRQRAEGDGGAGAAAGAAGATGAVLDGEAHP